MFIRFRERSNDGREPLYRNGFRVDGATLQCAGKCNSALRERRSLGNWTGHRAGPGFRCRSGCPLRPRCRWLIDGKPPYRLLVSLVENRRTNGKVRQEHIADFGAIDGHLLPLFYAEPDDGVSMWSIRSIWARLDFWDDLEERLGRLSNRISAEEADKVRAAVHARIPKPTDADIEKIEFWDAENYRSYFQNNIKSGRREIAQAERKIEESRQTITELESTVNEYDDHKREVTQWAMSEGDRKAIEERMSKSFERIDEAFESILRETINKEEMER
jgi:hypothetical protein